MRYWLIADTHFYHQKLVDLCGRPTDFSMQIYRHWVENVLPDDTVLHLGDFILGTRAMAASLIKILPGKIILIRGNHDRYSTKFYLDNGVAQVKKSMVLDHWVENRPVRLLLTHRPTNIPHDVDFNIHGHRHTKYITGSPFWKTVRLLDNHLLFCLEELGYKPVLLDDVLMKKVRLIERA